MKSEKEILELAKEKGWDFISCKEELSEVFIEKYQDKVDWSCISYNQKLSEDFILNNLSKINLNELKQNNILILKI